VRAPWPNDPPPGPFQVTQGLHVVSGVAAIPILLAKLWSAMPKLFEWPPVRSLAHLLERLSLALLVGGALLVFFTGIFNFQNWYPWKFGFVGTHYYAAFIFLGALVLHLVVKVPVALRAFRERGVVAPLRDDLARTEPEPAREGTTAPLAPAAATISRRGMLATVAAGSAGLAVIAAGQSLGGPFRRLALLAPREAAVGPGPNDFPVNRPRASVGIPPAAIGDRWRLRVIGTRELELSRPQLLELEQHTYSLPIACVEGWSTTQSWTGVRLRELARMAGVDDPGGLYAESLQRNGELRDVSLAANQVADERSLLALRVNGADLSEDHGFPARLMIPGAPGVHQTKWVAALTFEPA
jgi:hypothetical protein